jgi:shikimate dehydrogenase
MMRLALVGDPVDHSTSPALHRGFLEEAEIDGSYVAVRVARGDGISAVLRLRSEGYTGCNVTYPLKEETLNACDALTEEARRAEAVNTIYFGRQVVGTNTDGIGARSAIEALLDEPVALKRIGILGYGATARAILAELQDNDAYTFVWGRDARRAEQTCRRFEARPWPNDNPPEIVLSTLPPDVRLPDALVEELQLPDVVIDANYGFRAVLARHLNRDVVPGDAMLEAQARASFDFWLAHLDRVAGE